MSLVSVIIPAYNGEVYLEKAIASVLEQTYANYEIIVVDDGSTDNTRQVLEKYAITRVFQNNQGVARARNKGLEKAKGEYIAFLDQDDFFFPNKLTEQVSLMRQKPELGLVNSGWDIVDHTGKTLSQVQPWLNLPRLNSAELIIWKPVFLGAMLFRNSWLQKTDGFNPQWEQTPDVELVLRLAALGCQGDWVRKTTVAYRQHETNVSKNTIVQAQELNQMLETFFAQTNISPEVRLLEAESRYQSLVWIAWRLYSTGHLTEMSHYLLQSRFYTDKYLTEMIINWLEYFKKYAAEYGTTIDINYLCNSTPWQQLTKKLLAIN